MRTTDTSNSEEPGSRRQSGRVDPVSYAKWRKHSAMTNIPDLYVVINQSENPPLTWPNVESMRLRTEPQDADRLPYATIHNANWGRWCYLHLVNVTWVAARMGLNLLVNLYKNHAVGDSPDFVR